ncbi:MAG: hypothetical protein M1833_003664 [Piccolia ochrophora]|nr:MAG: hypothetical protein M1833_003664 [Piccolia ochrophora]
MVQNKSLVFKKIPEGWPVPGQDLVIETSDFDRDQAPPKGGITTQNYYVSFDPYQRGRMRNPEIKSYTPAFELGKPISNATIAKVLKSDNPKWQHGDVVAGDLPTQEHSVVEEDSASRLKKVENPYHLDTKLFTGALGMSGLTAYSSLIEIGKPKKGETIFVSAASGSVGQMVGQLAKHEGLTVIGSVGDDAKLDFIQKELNFDGGFNYKKENPMSALKRLAPQGIDIYYENVGGEQLDAALVNMNDFGRIVACGMVSQYNAKPNEAYGVKSLMTVVSKRLTMRGFIVFDSGFGPKYSKEHQEKMQKWIHEGTFKAKQSVTDGMDNAIDGFLGMLQGKNFGKAVLKLGDLETVSLGFAHPC